METEKKQVPWYDNGELQKIYEALYSGRPIKQRWAVERVSAWKSRGNTFFPIQVEVTTALIRAVIHDHLVCDNLKICNFGDVSLMYSIAVVRFTNLICDLKRDRNFKTPLRLIAPELNVPYWIICVRNDAAHGHIPHLDRLRETARVALLWLEENFWKQELETVLPQVLKLPEDGIRDILSEYQKMKYDSLYLPKSSKHQEVNKKHKCDSIILSKLTKLGRKTEDILIRFINVLVKPEFLLSVTACTKSILPDNRFIQEEIIELPHSIEKFWTYVITILACNGLIGNLIVALLNCHVDIQPQEQRMAIAWILRILNAFKALDRKEKKVSPIYVILKNYPNSVDWLNVYIVCNRNASKYVPAILPILRKFIDPPLHTDIGNTATGLVAIFIGAIPMLPSSNEVNRESYSIESVKGVLEITEVEKRGETTLYHSENPWELIEDNEFLNSNAAFEVKGSEKNLQLFKTDDSNEEDEKLNVEQNIEVPMEFEDDNNEIEIEFFNMRSFEENAAMKENIQNNESYEQNIVNCQIEDVALF